MKKTDKPISKFLLTESIKTLPLNEYMIKSYKTMADGTPEHLFITNKGSVYKFDGNFNMTTGLPNFNIIRVPMRFGAETIKLYDDLARENAKKFFAPDNIKEILKICATRQSHINENALVEALTTIDEQKILIERLKKITDAIENATAGDAPAENATAENTPAENASTENASTENASTENASTENATTLEQIHRRRGY